MEGGWREKRKQKIGREILLLRLKSHRCLCVLRCTTRVAAEAVLWWLFVFPPEGKARQVMGLMMHRVDGDSVLSRRQLLVVSVAHCVLVVINTIFCWRVLLLLIILQSTTRRLPLPPPPPHPSTPPPLIQSHILPPDIPEAHPRRALIKIGHN